MYKKILKNTSTLAILVGLMASVGIATSAETAQAAACPTPATDLGAVSVPITVPATATYTIWTRMKAPDTTHNTVSLQVDTTSCFSVGGGSFTATSWSTGSGNWIKYQNGSTANVITVSLNAGAHTL